MPKLVVFDCDGTLVDSQHAIVEAVKTAFDLNRLSIPEDGAIRRVVGLSLPHAMQVLIADGETGDVTAVTRAYKRAFYDIRARSGHSLEPLFPGIAEALAALAAAGFLLAVATGKSRRGVAATLAHHKLDHHFVSVQTADEHPSKPDPAMLATAIAEAGSEPATTVLVGDTSYDMAMARSAGALGLGVAWGYHPPEELKAAGAAVIAPDGHALCRLASQLLEG